VHSDTAEAPCERRGITKVIEQRVRACTMHQRIVEKAHDSTREERNVSGFLSLNLEELRSDHWRVTSSSEGGFVEHFQSLSVCWNMIR
jgi:hypothetical protein